MTTLFAICFFTGVLFAVMSVAFGGFFDHDIELDGLPYLSPTTIASFVTVFGGIGLLLMKTTELSLAVILLISIVSAVTCALLIFSLVMVPLRKAEKSNSGSQKDMIGQIADVITPIEKNTKGEIVYRQGASLLSAPATTRNSERIVSGRNVKIVEVVAGTFIVEEIGKEKGEKANEF